VVFLKILFSLRHFGAGITNVIEKYSQMSRILAWLSFVSTADCRQSTNPTKATRPRYDCRTLKTVTDDRRHKLRKTHSSTHDHRNISAAVNCSQFRVTEIKHLYPMPSPVDTDIAVTATEVDDTERDTHAVACTCVDHVTCSPSMTSHSGLPATNVAAGDQSMS